MVSDRVPVRRLPAWTWSEQLPTWRDARPGLIEAALKRAQARPSGNWYVLAASREIRGDRPFGRTIAGVEVV
ncbi:MAG: 2Fe-2S ferredoxin, partial [Pseudonocardiaceae bacterium]